MENLVRENKFREDLYYRLKVHKIEIPPLRERLGDIPLLVEHFLALFHKQGKRITSINPDALCALQAFSWPGNIRQLKNEIESAIFWAQSRHHSQIEVEDISILRHVSGDKQQKRAMNPNDMELSIDKVLAQTELATINKALQLAEGKKSEASILLGLNDRFALTKAN